MVYYRMLINDVQRLEVEEWEIFAICIQTLYFWYQNIETKRPTNS